MTPREKDLLRATWLQVVRIGAPAMALFYKRLFEIDPGTARLFVGADMTAQHNKLLVAISAVIDGLDDLAPLIPVLEDLGRRHVGWGVTDDHYDSVGAALLWTLEQGLGEGWKEDAARAWAAAYTMVADVMKGAGNKPLEAAA